VYSTMRERLAATLEAIHADGLRKDERAIESLPLVVLSGSRVAHERPGARPPGVPASCRLVC
jgi:hypothetical protein